MRIWLLRAAWITLPVAAGPALSSALHQWSDGPRVVGAALCWTAWGAGLLATLAPRPAGLTVLRAVAPAGLVIAIVIAVSNTASTLAAAAALAVTVGVAVMAVDSEIAFAAANAVAYGNEERYPLRVPPALFAGPLPVARALAVGGVAAGPLLLADGDVLWGVIALVLAVPVVALAGRALHSLSRRWLVLVPAGVVVVDPMALADNVLFPRPHVRAVRAVAADEPTGDALDLRLGATLGSLVLQFDEPAELTRAVRARRGGDTVDAPAVLIAVARRRRRRVPVEVQGGAGRPEPRAG